MRFLVAALAALTLSSCAASGYVDTRGNWTGGYEEEIVSDGVWRLSYYGNGYTTDETVQTYWLYRAAEITLEHGYDGFRILTPVELTEAPAMLQRAQYSAGEARLTPIVQRELGGKPYMVAQIQVLRAPLPDAPRQVFDARALRDFLDPYVHGDKCESVNVCPHVHRYLFPGFAPQRVAPEQGR